MASSPQVPANPSIAYVTARAASISGNHSEAAQIYARLAAASKDSALGERATSEAIRAGDMAMALRLIAQSGRASSIDSKLLVIADALKRGRTAQALQFVAKTGERGDLSFWEPLVQAWAAAERRDPQGALAILSRVPQSSPLYPFVDEESAFILLKAGKSAEADPYARRAIASAGAREYRVRLALAAGFAAARDRQRAAAILDGVRGDTTHVRKAMDAGGLKSLAIDSAAKAYSDQLVALALQMRNSESNPDPALNIIQIAAFAAPESSSAAILLGTSLAEQERLPEALAALRSVPASDALRPEALDAEVRALINAGRTTDALAAAKAAADQAGASGDDYARLGDVYGELKRHAEAAEAYGQAVARLRDADGARIWPLLLLQAGEFESAGRWPEAKAALASAIEIAPDEPLILNFLGYAKLEHGEDLDAAEALIRKASELAPDDASITDSLGWALYKRGRYDQAIDVLQKAAIGDPAQAEIQEHLGDALYSAGRKFEARFAWQAALATAEEKDAARIRSKIESGLTTATAAR